MSGAQYFRDAQIDLKNKSRLLDNRFGDMSPIDNGRLPNMPRGSIVVLTEKIKDLLEQIQRLTALEQKEIPFLLFGKTYGQEVYFNQIIVDVNNLQSAEANFDSLVPGLEKFIHESKKDGTDIIAHGHSHPEIGRYYDNFSLGDMNAYKTMRFGNELYNSGKIELCSCLLTNGCYNFLFFDGNDYYKFNDVFVQAENGKITEKLPCYKKINSGGLHRER